ncbi:MAG: TIGR02117 family protein [Cytophagaceae bacterium]|jgi:uncharacterized protein (TIGR02117 family)|nr:TIGR02117 family protein [Cytophagaceae bacterium]
MDQRVQQFVDFFRRKWKSWFRFLGWVLVIPCIVVAIYFVSAGIGTLWPINGAFPEENENSVLIFVRSNGVHTDLVVPVESPQYSWRRQLDLSLFKHPNAPYLSIGWGDKGFYLHTPEWKDLKFSTACKAAFWLSTSAMHLSTSAMPLESETCKPIRLSQEQYQSLCQYIHKQFQRNENQQVLPIHGHHYAGSDDYFFEAEGTYSFLNTCNCWANNGLKAARVTTAAWAPFDWCIFYHR